MRSNDVLGFIFAGTLDEKIPELAASRTTASVPIGGKYRLIDFVLSNMSNSGVNNVGIVAKSNEDYELQEVNNKLGALRRAIEQAEHLAY